MKERLKQGTGITLIALVLTIIVLLILAGVSIAMLTGDNGILTQAQKAKMSTELSSYKEQVELFKLEQTSKNNGFLDESLTAGKSNLFYNTQPVEEQGKGTIRDVIKNISDEYFEKIEIIKGELLINTKDNEEIKLALSLGIRVNPYDIVDGVLLSTGNNLALVDENGAITIPDNVTKIGEGAFANVSGLKTIIIPGTVKEIADNAFSSNQTLENVIMNEGTEKIGKSSFESCSSLKNINLPNTLTSIGAMCFYSCKNLTDITIPDQIKTINSMCFSMCTNLENITLNEGLLTIGQRAFESMPISSISIPSTVVDISDNAFSNNTNLENIILQGNENFVYETGMLMTNEKDRIIFISDKYLKNINRFDIPNGITSFSLNLSNYNNITQISIPGTTTSIRFDYLPTSITTVEISNSNPKLVVSDTEKLVYTKDTKELISCYSKESNIEIDMDEKIGLKELSENSFFQAINAKKIKLGPSITTIENGVFSNCKSVETIEIGENVSDIDGAFKVGNYSGNVIINSQNDYYIVENNILYSKSKKELVTVLYNISGSFEMDNSVETIGNNAFYNQRNLSAISISSKIKSIESSAFQSCVSLTGIEIPSTIEKISNNAFTGCINLDKIKIDKNENLIDGAPWGATKGMKVVEWKQ